MGLFKHKLFVRSPGLDQRNLSVLTDN